MPLYSSYMNNDEDKLILEFGKVLKEQNKLPSYPVTRAKNEESRLRAGVTKFLLRNVVKEMQEAQKAK